MSAFHITPKMIAMEAARLIAFQSGQPLDRVSRQVWAGILHCAGSSAAAPIVLRWREAECDITPPSSELLLSLDDFSARWIEPAAYHVAAMRSRAPANEDR